MNYNTLILGRGTVEGANLAELIVCYVGDEDFDTPRAALTDFRNAICAVLKSRMKIEVDEGVCSLCEKRNEQPYDRFCGACGRKLKREQDEDDLCSWVAGWFQDLFKLELHEFSDWEEIMQYDWNIRGGGITSGGFVRLEGFDRMLENWEDPGWTDNLGEGRTWWEVQLSEAGTGGILST